MKRMNGMLSKNNGKHRKFVWFTSRVFSEQKLFLKIRKNGINN